MLGTTDGGTWDELRTRIRVEECGFPAPSPRVVGLAERLRGEGVRSVLDVGCGVGRHAAYLAARGFHVYASDGSPAALRICRKALDAAGVCAELLEAPMTEIDLPDNLVDWAVAENALYHGRRSDMEQALQEIRRVLKPGGFFSATFLSTAADKCRWYRDQLALGRAEEIEPETYRALFRGVGDEHVPHAFVSGDELKTPGLLEGFDGIEVEEEVRAVHPSRSATAAYYHILCRKADSSPKAMLH